jgi:hypothetical protein
VRWYKILTQNRKADTDESTKAQWSPYEQLQQSNFLVFSAENKRVSTSKSDQNCLKFKQNGKNKPNGKLHFPVKST